MKKLFFLLLLAHFLKEIVWLGLIPIWHFPDEEQHFSQVAFYGEKNRFPHGQEFDVNQEIDTSSTLLGTKRDSRGINKFTYHSDYRIPYLQGETGLYENEIKALNTVSSRETMVKREAARYGPVYYLFSSVFYRIFNKSDLLVRIFSVRLGAVILSTLTISAVYLIAKQVFSSSLAALGLGFLVSFQPMFSFVSAGVNSDNFFNLIFTLLIYLNLRIFFSAKVKKRRGWLNFILLLMVMLLGFYTKQQMIISLGVIFLGFSFWAWRKGKRTRQQWLALTGLILVIFASLLVNGKIKIPEYESQLPSQLSESVFQYLFWHLKHTVAETIPWYWGVFNWLGVTLPRWTNQIQARILIISGFGVLFYFYKQIKERKIFKQKNLKIIFLFGTAVLYYFAIIFWDYFFRKTQGFSFGLQGRYFFPTISCHLILIILGLISLVPKKFKALAVKILCLWWFAFQLIGLATAALSYYQLWPLSVFLNQASQYKPAVFKGPNLLIILLVFFVSSIVFLINLLRFNEKKIN